MTDVIEGEVVELATIERGNLLAAATGQQMIERATERADVLAKVVRDKQLSVAISGREHVKVEGWTLLGSLMGVFPVSDYVKEIRDHEGDVAGFEARVEARTISGAVVGAALARCMRDEKNWSDRDDYALMSMAQTRATSKALRMPLGFVMALAGYDPTPAEEIPNEQKSPTPSPSGSAKANRGTETPERSGAARSGAPIPASDKQIKAVWAIATSKGIRDELEAVSYERYECSVGDLSGGRDGSASDLIGFLQDTDQDELVSYATECASKERPL